MHLKDKLGTFVKVILSIPIAIGLTIPLIISLLIIPIIELIFVGLLKALPSKARYEHSEFVKAKDFVKERYVSVYQDEYFGNLDYRSVENSVNQRNDQSEDEIGKRLLSGYAKFHDDKFDEFLKAVRFVEEESTFSNIVKRISTIPKVFLFLFLKALKAIGLPYPDKLESEYKKGISEVFGSLKFEALTLFKAISCIREEKNMEDIWDNFASGPITCAVNKNIENMFSSNLECAWFTNQFSEIRDTTSDKQDKKNECIKENIVGIIRLLLKSQSSASVHQVGEDDVSSSEPSFEGYFCNLIRDLDPNNYGKDSVPHTPEPRLLIADVQVLEEKFSDFLNNFLKNHIPNTLSSEDRESYVIACCKKVLNIFISGKMPKKINPDRGRINKMLLPMAIKHSIGYSLGSKELANIHTLVSQFPESEHSKIMCTVLKPFLSKESMMPGLRDVVKAIFGIAKKHIKVNRGHSNSVNKSSLPSSTLSLSQDDTNKVIRFSSSSSIGRAQKQCSN